MTLEVIGVGFGRTGTTSVKAALEVLGYGPCYHMGEVNKNPPHIPLWNDMLDGKTVPWESIFGEYRATLDWPAAYFWRDLVAHYPDAKVLLTVRDAGKWYESVFKTIYQLQTGQLGSDDPVVRDRVAMGKRVVLEGTFGGKLGDRDHAISVYERHIEEVREHVSAARLLVYEVASGWGPLCEFLGSEVPHSPFPDSNAAADFRDRYRQS